MTRQYDSFVLRCWQVGADERRIEVEHLQSGRRTRAAVLTAAVDWITTQCDAGLRDASDGDAVSPARLRATR